jgi:hypothetical protein
MISLCLLASFILLLFVVDVIIIIKGKSSEIMCVCAVAGAAAAAAAIEYYGDIGHNLYALVSEIEILDKRGINTHTHTASLLNEASNSLCD